MEKRLDEEPQLLNIVEKMNYVGDVSLQVTMFVLEK